MCACWSSPCTVRRVMDTDTYNSSRRVASLAFPPTPCYYYTAKAHIPRDNYVYLERTRRLLHRTLSHFPFMHLILQGSFILHFSFFEGVDFTSLCHLKDVWHVHSLPKVWFDHNFSSSRYNENLKKSAVSKLSRTCISHNNKAEKSLRNYIVFFIVIFLKISNEVIDFSESKRIFSILFYVHEILFLTKI